MNRIIEKLKKQNKTFIILMVIAVSAVTVISCGTESDQENKEEDLETSNLENGEKGTSKNSSAETLPYKEFELEIESDDRELEVEFKQDEHGMFAEVEFEEYDETKMDLEGSAALEYVLPILKNLEINNNMSQEELIDRILTAFDWSWHYDEFEIEVEFTDGSYIDFEL